MDHAARLKQSKLSFDFFICFATIIGGYHNLTTHFRIFHGILKSTSTSKRAVICQNIECKAQFFDFRPYREHILHCESLSSLQPLQFHNTERRDLVRDVNVASPQLEFEQCIAADFAKDTVWITESASVKSRHSQFEKATRKCLSEFS